MPAPSGARPSVCRSRASSPGCRSRRSAIASTLPYVTRNWPEDETADTTGSVAGNATAPQSIALPSSGLLGASTTDPLFFNASSQHNVQFEQRFAAVTDRFESRPFIPAGSYERTVRSKDHPPMIIPRARQQQASLPPATGTPDPRRRSATAEDRDLRHQCQGGLPAGWREARSAFRSRPVYGRSQARASCACAG